MKGVVIGVDPGVNGGIAVVTADKGHVVHVAAFKPKMKETEVLEIMRGVMALYKWFGGGRCLFEKVGYMPGDGGKGANTFGKVDGFFRGSLLALGAKPQYVPPAMWQSYLGCLTSGNKNITKRFAQKRFPELKVTHNIADALLIAEYGRLKFYP